MVVKTMAIIVNIQKQFKTGLVKTNKGKIFPVKIQDQILNRINLNDAVTLKKSSVSKEWVITGVKA